MMLLIVWIMFLLVFAFITIAWFTATPAFFAVADAMQSTFDNLNLGASFTSTYNTVNSILGYSWWWVLFILLLGLFAWAVMTSTKREPVSYGGEA